MKTFAEFSPMLKHSNYYFDGSTKLFSDLAKFLNILAKSFYALRDKIERNKNLCKNKFKNEFRSFKIICFLTLFFLEK